jgi:hypothetical protein
MLQDRIVEVGVRPWKSQSVEQFTSRPSNAPQLIAEKTKKKVIFPSELSIDQQHVYENIDDCREQGVEHPRKILPMPSKRLPFRQPARVPVLSIPKIDPLAQPEPETLEDVGPEISFVSYRFYDKNMREQNSLSQRCSAQLLRKSAIRLSLPRSKSNGVSSYLSSEFAQSILQTPLFLYLLFLSSSFSTVHILSYYFSILEPKIHECGHSTKRAISGQEFCGKFKQFFQLFNHFF